MRRLGTLWLAAALVAITAVFAASAAAGGGQGNDGKQGGDAQASQQQGSGNDQGSKQQKSGDQQSTSGGGQSVKPAQSGDAGTKPGSDTSKWTTTHVGDKPDVSKRYGNGKTAAEIAADRGAPDSTILSGPGNSQPHKVTACGKKGNRSGGVDVHAVKSYSSSDCQTQKPEPQPQQPEARKPVEAKPAEQKQLELEVDRAHADKVTICHATGSATNPFVAITVDRHALEHGHTAAKGDIVPAPAGGCPTASADTGSVLGATASVCGAEQAKGDDDSRDASASKDEPKGDEDNDGDECTTSSTASAGLGASVFGPTAPTHVVAAATSGLQQAAPATTPPAASMPPTVDVSNARAATQNAPTAAATPQGQGQGQGQGQVLGAIASLTPKKHAAHGGVLGAVGSIAGTTLPFTGFPVWLALLAALALLALGLVLRRGGGTAARP